MIQDLLSAVDKHVLLETAAYATQLTGVEFQHHLLAKIRRVTSSESSNLIFWLKSAQAVRALLMW